MRINNFLKTGNRSKLSRYGSKKEEQTTAKLSLQELLYLLILQNPRFKNFGSSRNSLNPTLRPDLRPNSDDSLYHVIDSCKIFGSTLGVRPNENKTDLGWFQQRIRLNVESCSHQNPKYTNSYLKNPPNRILNRFFKLNPVENKMHLEPESSSRK